MDELLYRLKSYEDAGLDWVQFESPHSVEEVRQARAAVKGNFSVMRGKLPQFLTLDEHRQLGLTAAWWTFLPNSAMYAMTQAFLTDLQARGLDAWLDLQSAAERGEVLATARVSA
jgi:2-methylisocitrate lyase-like PEP mutase family enzyme